MMKMLMTLVVLALAGPCIAEEPTQLAGLPVAPGGPGQGPWELKIWPWQGCPACVASKEDEDLYAAILQAMMSGDYRAIPVADISVRMVRLAQGQTDGAIAFSDLHQRVQNCKIGSHDILPAAKNSSPGTTFALGLDCSDQKEREFISITIMRHRIVNIYYLPDGPIWVLTEAAAQKMGLPAPPH